MSQARGAHQVANALHTSQRQEDSACDDLRALEGKYPRATYKIVEEIVKVEKNQEKLAYYEVLLVTAGKDTLEVLVTPEGRIVKEEKKKPGEDD
jgi:hypothetical protein